MAAFGRSLSISLSIDASLGVCTLSLAVVGEVSLENIVQGVCCLITRVIRCYVITRVIRCYHITRVIRCYLSTRVIECVSLFTRVIRYYPITRVDLVFITRVIGTVVFDSFCFDGCGRTSLSSWDQGAIIGGPCRRLINYTSTAVVVPSTALPVE